MSRNPRFKEIVIVGVGGTGSQLIEPLARLALYEPNGTDNITVIDGDVIEKDNLTRQVYNVDDQNKNKAVVIVEKLNRSLKTNFKAFQAYVNYKNFANYIQTIKGTSLIITAVDNHRTRHEIIKVLDETETQNFVLLSPGNSFSDGQVIIYAKKNGIALTMHPFKKYKELAIPQDYIPGTVGCVEKAKDQPQLITANAGSALTCLWLVRALLAGQPWFEEVHFDSIKMKILPHGKPIQEIF